MSGLIAHLDIIFLSVEIMARVHFDKFSWLLVYRESFLIRSTSYKVIYIRLIGVLMDYNSLVFGSSVFLMLQRLTSRVGLLWIFLDQYPFIHTNLIRKTLASFENLRVWYQTSRLFEGRSCPEI